MRQQAATGSDSLRPGPAGIQLKLGASVWRWDLKAASGELSLDVRR